MEGDPEQVNQGIRRAVELMTAWNESNDGDTSLAVGLVSNDLAEAATHGTLLSESTTLISGLMSLSGRLLIELERASGRSISNILQKAGQQAAE